MKTLYPLFAFLVLVSCHIKQPDQVNPATSIKDLKLPDSPVFYSKIFAAEKHFNSLESHSLKYIANSLINSMQYLIMQNVDSIAYFKDAALVFDSTEGVNGLYEYSPGLTKYFNTMMVKKDSMLDSKLGKIKMISGNTIKIDIERKTIIDNMDTLPIMDHWPDHKFIFVDAVNSTNPVAHKTPFSRFNTIIYTYK